MRKFAAIVSAAALGLGLQSAAHAYNVTTAVTFTFGGSALGAGIDQGFFAAAPVNVPGGLPTNSTLISALTGANTNGAYNQNFASSAQCVAGAGVVPSGSAGISTRKYGCRYTSSGGLQFLFAAIPAVDSGPVAQASGSITVTNTSLTGTLTIVNTSDEPTGATTTFNTGSFESGTSTTRLSNSIGNGFAGYNYQTALGSPFGNVWYGVTNAGTYTLNLTGTFNSTNWNISGGSATFTDPGFACQQGGTAGTSGSDQRGLLCAASSTGGNFDPNGGHLSWGMDPDGAVTVSTASQIEIRSEDGSSQLGMLSGVIANMGIAVNGDITTNSGEFRRGVGLGSCTNHIRFNTATSQLACGAILAGQLNITGTVPDTDGDGVRDGADNCTLVSNPTQIDSNGDGYGNICDADINNSGLTTSSDFNLLRACINQAGYPTGSATCQASDMNGSGLVTSTDFNLLRARINTAPGPSGVVP